MYKFLLAQPKNKKREFIFHTVEPKCMIEIIHLVDEEKLSKSNYPFKIFDSNTTGGILKKALVIKDFYTTTSENYNVSELLDKAWKWFYYTYEKERY